MIKVLVVDDDPVTRLLLSETVREEGFTVSAVSTLTEAREHIRSTVPDLLLLDVKLPDGNGLDLLNDLEDRFATEVVLITAHGTAEDSLKALWRGASDYLVKPVNPHFLRQVLQQVTRTHELKREVVVQREKLQSLGHFGSLLGASRSMQAVYEQITKVAPTDATVLIVGESGTGKELAAKTVHAFSRRRNEPFLPVNCGAISPGLIESELLGHEEGSFTGAKRTHRGYFERASGGTLFLDEVTEMPLELQVKLLRVLETGTIIRTGGQEEIKIDVRVVAATNRPPASALREGKLREDLFYRLSVFVIHMPPLRDRQEDIELLAGHFLAKLNKSHGTSKKLNKTALECMCGYNWPGNARELKNFIHRAFIMAKDEITPDFMPLLTNRRGNGFDTRGKLEIDAGLPLAEAEKRLILASLELYGGSKRKAAEALGVSRRTLYNHLKLYKLE